MTPWIATEAKGKGYAVGGPTLVGGSHQGVIGYFLGPSFCSVIADLDDPEAPYWGVVLGVNLTEGSTDATTCVANGGDTCLKKIDYAMSFCSTYLHSDTFCARNFNQLVVEEPATAGYVAALDNHAKACVLDTFEEGVVFDPTNACHKAVAYGSCNNVFPVCSDNSEITTNGPRGVCKNDCILERYMCRTDYTSWFSLESITKFNCGGEPFVDVKSDPSMLCSGSLDSDAVIGAEHLKISMLSLLYAAMFFGVFILGLIIFSVRTNAQILKMKQTAQSKNLPEWKPKQKDTSV